MKNKPILTVLAVLISISFVSATNITITTTPTNPHVGERITIGLDGATSVNTTTTNLEIVTPTRKLRYLTTAEEIRFPVTYTPRETGRHLFQLIDRILQLVLTQTNTTVLDQQNEDGQAEGRKQRVFRNNYLPRENTFIPEHLFREAEGIILRGRGNISVENITITEKHRKQSGTAGVRNLRNMTGMVDIEIDLKTERIHTLVLEDVMLPQTVDVGLEEVQKPVRIEQRETVTTYAVDPTRVNFTRGNLTITATGTELWKCPQWNFTTQSCDGAWRFLQKIVPGENYTIVFNSTDPGFGETIPQPAGGFVEPSLNENFKMCTDSLCTVLTTNYISTDTMYVQIIGNNDLGIGKKNVFNVFNGCLLYTSPSPRD